MSVTVFASLYGEGYDKYVPDWIKAVRKVKGVDAVIIGSDRERDIKSATVVVGECDWTYPSAYFQNLAVAAADTEFVWQMQIDDIAHADALDGLPDDVDVWQVGYQRTDGFSYCPLALSGAELLASPDNPFVMASVIRKSAFDAVGGYPDIAYEDWGLWRKLARAGARFGASGRVGFTYTWHPEESRTAQDAKNRSTHMAEAIAL